MKRVLFVVAVAAMLVLSACTGGSQSSDGLKVMLSYKKSIYWLPLLVAQDRGYLEQEGVTLDLQETNGSGFVTQQLIAGQAPVGWAGAPDGAVAFATDESLRALMCNPPQNIFRIIVPQDSSITSVAGLKGKTLGISEAGGGEEPIVNASLKDAGLERGKDVTVLPIGDAGPASLNAILDGTVDAYAGSYPDISTLSADGRLQPRDITPSKYNDIPGDCMIVKNDTLQGPDRDAIVGLARAWAKGAVFAAANPAAAKSIACKQVPQECEDEAFATKYVQDTIDLMNVGNGSTPFGAVDTAAWQTTFDVLTESGALTSNVNPAVFADPAELEKFRAEYYNFSVPEIQEEARTYVGS
ncbi:ABC transporter substrate-binding protein [Gordonia sp. NPDC003376]